MNPSTQNSKPIDGLTSHVGITLRQHYAGLADVPWDAVIDTLRGIGEDKPTIGRVVEYRAAMMLAQADALLAALAQTAPVASAPDPRIAKCEALLALILDPSSGCTMTGVEAFTVMRSKLRAALTPILPMSIDRAHEDLACEITAALGRPAKGDK